MIIIVIYIIMIGFKQNWKLIGCYERAAIYNAFIDRDTKRNNYNNNTFFSVSSIL